MVSTLIALVLSLLVQVQSPNVPLATKLQALALAQQVMMLVQTQASPQATTSPVATSSENSQSQSSDPTPMAAGNPPPPFVPLVPTCLISETIVQHSNPAKTGNPANWQVYFSWDMDPSATGLLSGYGTLPSYTSHVTNSPSVSVIQSEKVATYTLTETMTDPSYQTTTTCQVTADTSDL